MDTEESFTEEETRQLLGHLQNYMSGEEMRPTDVSPELAEYFREFILGLTFPSAVDVGATNSRRRWAFIAMSNMWHDPFVRATMKEVAVARVRGERVANALK